MKIFLYEFKNVSFYCLAICWASGDPHYMTFDGKHYTFMGACGYVLTKSKDFNVTAENIKCGTSGVTCTKSVDVKIKQNRITLIHGGNVTVNGINLPNYQFKSGDIDVFKAGNFLHIITHIGLKVQWDFRKFVFNRTLKFF